MTAHLDSSIDGGANPAASPGWPKRRLVAVLLLGGGCVLVVRTLMLAAGGALTTYRPWAAGLLVTEFVFDAVAVALLVRWAALGHQRSEVPALRAVAAVVVVHAVRVLVFVMGRTGPWVDFDVRPQYRPDHAETWTWAGVWFAAAMVVASLAVLLIVMASRRHRSRASTVGRPPHASP